MDLDAAALAPATGVDLGFDDPNRSTEVLGDLFGLLRRVGNPTAGHSDPVLGEDALGLILMNIHGTPNVVTLFGRRKSGPP
jgi:hypothetical protein